MCLLATLLTACAISPPAPDWQATAHAALERALAAYLAGDARAHAQEAALARREIARTGRPDVLARAELMLCAARVASLVFGPCDGFEGVRADAAPAERAYADYLSGRPLAPADAERLPAAQRRALARPDAVPAIDDPLARLIAAGVRFQTGNASPALIAAASETASAQGWRRPLLAWLGVQAALAEKAGRSDEAQRLRRRMEMASTPHRPDEGR
jgi:hypothetical protein